METKTTETKIILPPPEGVYTYVAVKGMLSSSDAIVFGLTVDEVSALLDRFQRGSIEYSNGVHVQGGPINVINTLAQIGYRVIGSTGENEVTWTLQREI